MTFFSNTEILSSFEASSIIDETRIRFGKKTAIVSIDINEMRRQFVSQALSRDIPPEKASDMAQLIDFEFISPDDRAQQLEKNLGDLSDLLLDKFETLFKDPKKYLGSLFKSNPDNEELLQFDAFEINAQSIADGIQHKYSGAPSEIKIAIFTQAISSLLRLQQEIALAHLNPEAGPIIRKQFKQSDALAKATFFTGAAIFLIPIFDVKTKIIGGISNIILAGITNFSYSMFSKETEEIDKNTQSIIWNTANPISVSLE